MGSKRRRGASAGAGGADLISGLADDVLVRILELLPDAGDVVRTGALSWRWRGLWTRVGSLTFDSSRRKFKKASTGDKRFLDFVRNALAQRGKTTDAAAAAALDLERLAISFAIMSPADDQATKPLVRRSTKAAREWIWYAMQKRAKSFVLKLQLFPIWNWYSGETDRCDIWKQNLQKLPMIDLTNLPSSAKLETMHWELKGVRLQLPATAVFTSLVDLSLENIELVGGSVRLLARLLSSACCPSLQKLQLTRLRFPDHDELLIEASSLLELSMSTSLPNVGSGSLSLKTPSLRILHIEEYPYLETRVRICAPKLEELNFLPSQPGHIEVDGELPCVGSLRVVELQSSGYEDEITDGGIYLLQCCISLTSLEVSLRVAAEEERGDADIISGRIAHLPHLICLTVHVHSSDPHSFGVGLSDILKQCSYLKYLRVHCTIDRDPCHRVDSLCGHLDNWKSHQIYLANIQEASFTGLAGTDCEISFIQRVLAHATQLQKVALSFDPIFKLHNMTDDSGFIPCNGGTWVCHDPSLSYEWNSGPIHK